RPLPGSAGYHRPATTKARTCRPGSRPPAPAAQLPYSGFPARARAPRSRVPESGRERALAGLRGRDPDHGGLRSAGAEDPAQPRHPRHSLGMYVVFTVGLCFWLAYGIVLGSWPMILSNVVTLVLALLILALKLRHG